MIRQFTYFELGIIRGDISGWWYIGKDLQAGKEIIIGLTVL